MKRRLFISLDIPEDLKKAVSRELEKVRYQFTDDVRFVDPEQWHVTVVFLGQQEDAAVSKILNSMKKTSDDSDAPEIVFSGITYGPRSGTPRMIWLNGSVKSSRSLQELKDRLEDDLVDNGVVFGKEHRQFNIHVTLAKFMSAENLPPLDVPFSHSFIAPTLDLMESRMSRDGVKYEFLQKMEFRVE